MIKPRESIRKRANGEQENWEGGAVVLSVTLQELPDVMSVTMTPS